MKSFLTDLQKQQLKIQHKRERDKRICDRIKAVLLSDKGWTNQQIAEALLLNEESVRLHINEFQSSYKLKPAIIPGKASVQAQKEWIEEYRKLKACLSPNDSICFIDGVHPIHNTKPTYGWIKKGTMKEIPTNSGRQRINISGAIDIISKKVVYHEDVTLNATSTITILKKLEESYPEADWVHVFCDNARYYKNKEVKKHLENSKIVMHFLPAYSPNLNPIERLWKLMYEHVLYNRYYEKYCEFKKAVLDFLDNLFELNNKFLPALMNRITDNFRAIGINTNE